MTWYYADWSWTRTLLTTATLVMGCVVVVCAIVTLVRSRLSARHAELLVTNGFAQRSRAEIERDARHAPHHQNGSRAA
jgi:hypothetical protein